jgi:hypothetical protein
MSDMTHSNFMMNLKKLVLNSFVSLPLLAVLQLLLNVHLSNYLNQNEHKVERPAERSYKIEPKLFETFSFGNLTSAIDWLWMNCIMDDSVEHVQPGKHPQLFFDLDLLTDLDPAYKDAYIAGANILSVVRNDGPGARDLLLKGEKFIQNSLNNYSPLFKEQYWNDPWALSTLLAYVYLFEINDMPHAAEAFRRAALHENAPPYITRLEKKLQKPGGEYEVGLKLLNFLLLSAKDVRIRTELEKKRYNLFIGQYIFDLNYSFREFLKTQPHYSGTSSVSISQLESHWKAFKKVNQVAEQDPWGGRLYLAESGRVKSTTPHDSVFGLE